MAKKKPKYLWDGVWGKTGRYVRAWKVGRSEIAVDVWNGDKPEGEPAGDWAMPRVLGLSSCIEQALLQTPKA